MNWMGGESRNLDFETNTMQKITDKCEPQNSNPRHCAQNADLDHYNIILINQ